MFNIFKSFIVLAISIAITACGGGDSSDKVTPPKVNVAPVITSIELQSFDEKTDYELTVTASDSDGSIVSYEWEQLSGDALILTSSDAATVNITTPDVMRNSDGQLQVKVTDDDGGSTTEIIDFTLIANLAPSAEFSFRCIKTECTFSSTSIDLDGDVISTQWDFGDGQTSNLPEASMVYSDYGSYPIVLTVTDNDGDIDVITSAITVIDYKQPSYITRQYYSYKDYAESIQNLAGGHIESVMLDYNNDGYLDIVHTNSDYSASFEGDAEAARRKILFYKGNSAGELALDEALSNKLDGLEHGRKGIVGDFNDDGYPDIFFAGHGIDTDPFPGEYPILLMNNSGNGFNETRFQNLIGFFHSITSGDYDNDGDLDVMLSDSYLLKNDGKGQFEIVTKIGWESENFIVESFMPQTSGVFTTELFDINKDGYLDLITTGHDWESESEFSSAIFYGDGIDFNNDNVTLPYAFGYGVSIDIDFFDINQDGDYEIILNRTGDPENGLGFYEGWAIQILELDTNSYIDSTEKFISNYVGESGSWMYWLQIGDYDNDGVIELFNDDIDDYHMHKHREWELIDGNFIKVQ